MKKFVVAGLLAIGITAIAHQEASAWVNSRFGIGLNWDFQSGGNQLLWGAWRNGQPPGPEAFGGGGGYHHGGQHFGSPMPQGHGYAPMPQQQYAPSPRAYSTSEPPMTAQPMYYSSPYQFANYPRPVYYYYYPAPYYYGQ